MITQIANIYLFYPMLFITIIISMIVICSVIKSKNGNMTFKDIFYKSSDNVKEITIDTTDKMKSMHDNVIKVDFTSSHEKELHRLEVMVEDLNNKFDLLLQRVIKLENKK